MTAKAKGDATAVPIQDSDRRRAPRVLVDLEVDYASEENYLFAYITDISATGIFVRTTTPEQPGTHLNLRFPAPKVEDLGSSAPFDDLGSRAQRRQSAATRSGAVDDLGSRAQRRQSAATQGGAVEVIECEGEVIWINPYRPGAPDNLHPGMGIRFVGIDDELRDRLLALIRRFAYLS